ncbi:ABC transporter ATP-binding protein [Corynebacterium breve]|uniref:ABC transporter ATP-binding protein n=1 Tax=Corynebacterium breve TaxID=3049799 RepID=A0ABY8VGV1_9CORY|nr:ABC transporter ATP-binding protein [Corynebacterium breve]WIM68547.1 ABC transporter ATP-binding protein [Corynebacterium breve]
MTKALEARGLSYHHAVRPDPAFTNVTFSVDRGQRVLITGDSGTGKSTLLHLIAGLLHDEEDGTHTGEITVNGSIGMVLQDPDSQVISTRVGDDVAFGCENLGVPREEIWPRVTHALDMVGLRVPLDHSTARLSGGQKQRHALAGVLAMGADIIILDEPTANLDPAGTLDVVDSIRRVCESTGATLIVVEHNPKPWLPIVDKLLHLEHDGIAEITTDELPTIPQLPPRKDIAPGTSIEVGARELRPYWGPARTFELPQGHSTVLTGPNGSGKTTIAAALAGLTPPHAGELYYSDELRQGLRNEPHKWKSQDLARRVGYVFQDPEHQFLMRTVAEELAVSGASQARQDELAERLRLTHLLQANPFTLSGGEKRRLSVVTALVNAPRFVVLDEPTFGQDTQTFTELVHLIRELTDQGVTVMSITHDEHFVASLGDHQVVLR